MQAHILYLSPIEISSLVGNFELKVGNFEPKSYPKGWEAWPTIFVFDQSPHPIYPVVPPPLSDITLIAALYMVSF